MKRKDSVFILAVIVAISFIGTIQNYLGMDFQLAVISWLVAVILAGVIHYRWSTISWDWNEKQLKKIKEDIKELQKKL